MAECRFFPECARCNEVGDSWFPCEGGADGTRCEDYAPMPDVDALLALADEIEYGASSDDGEYHDLPATMVAAVARKQMEYARRIREACGMVDAG